MTSAKHLRLNEQMAKKDLKDKRQGNRKGNVAILKEHHWERVMFAFEKFLSLSFFNQCVIVDFFHEERAETMICSGPFYYHGMARAFE